MNRLLPLMGRFMPRLFKTATLGYALYSLAPTSSNYTTGKLSCFSFQYDDQVDPINNLLAQVFKVCIDGGTIGYAFCIKEDILVTASPALLEKHKEKRPFEFYLRDENIQANYEVLGSFENLTFFKINKANVKIEPMPSIKSSQRIPITPVQVVQKRSYLSINHGYIVTKSAGFGIVDGRGEVGSLVIANGKSAGVITQIGRDSEKGFLRMAAWGDLLNLLRRLNNEPLYLGISAAAMEERDGLAIARVSANSPFKKSFQMGDIITRVDGQNIRQVDDLKRIIMLSSQSIQIRIERDGKPIDVTVQI